MYAYVHEHMLDWSNRSVNKFARSVTKPDLSSVLVTFMVDRKKQVFQVSVACVHLHTYMHTDRQTKTRPQNKQINKVIKAIVLSHHKYILNNNSESFKVIL